MSNVRRREGEFLHIHITEEMKMESGSRISGSLIPMVTDNPDHSLGKPNLPWHDAYLSSGSLYVDDQRALYAVSGTVTLPDDARIGGQEILKELVALKGSFDTLSERFESLSGSVSRSQGEGGRP